MVAIITSLFGSLNDYWYIYKVAQQRNANIAFSEVKTLRLLNKVTYPHFKVHTLVWLFAQAFYRYRQRRWYKLISTKVLNTYDIRGCDLLHKIVDSFYSLLPIFK